MEDTYNYIHNQVIKGVDTMLKNNKITLDATETDELTTILTEAFVKQNLSVYELYADTRLLWNVV